MPTEPRLARLTHYGMLAATGTDAAVFLHAQLTNTIAAGSQSVAVQAGWCSAKGRLLATFLVVPAADGFLLQLARDLAPAVRKRLAMFILRSKVKLEDESERWAQYGLQGEGASGLLQRVELQPPGASMQVSRAANRIAVQIARERYLLLVPAEESAQTERQLGLRLAEGPDWMLEDIRAGRPLVTAKTQELYVPQMLNLHELGAIDFKKGCYPGQEIVARTQYRGELKRRMVYAKLQASEDLAAGQSLYSDDLPGQESGSVVNAVRDGEQWELLAVVPVSATETASAVRTAPGGNPLAIGRAPGAA